MRYSPSVKCGYPEDVLYPDLPADLIHMPEEEWDRAMSRPSGYDFSVSGDGIVTLLPPSPPTATQLAAQARAERNILIAECDWLVQRHRDELDTTATTTLTTMQYQAWLAYRHELRDVPAQTGFPQAIAWPSKPI